jgi:anti-sigma regulatory factor (Ser/Thr protein kinase)
MDTTQNLENRRPNLGVESSGLRQRTREIREFVLDATREHPADLVTYAAKSFSLTHEGARRHVAELVRQGQLIASGNARSRRYSLPEVNLYHRTYLLAQQPEEHAIWRDEVAPSIGNLPANVRTVLEYGAQEMINNAIEHSEGASIHVRADRTAVDLTIWVMDDGIGVFEKIRAALRLPGAGDAVIELVKGKITTDPRKHTGEGIYFTSRAVDDFGLSANQLFWSARYDQRDWLLENKVTTTGTTVYLRMKLKSPTQLSQVFGRYEGPDHRFSKTQIPVVVGRVIDEGLVSRSAARRLMGRLEAFDEVLLDFAGVKSIGQAFADEVFRVYATANPNRRITPLNAGREVKKMIKRVRGSD